MSFGDKLREARKRKGLTQKELSEQIGVKHNSISNWEKDQNKPDADIIERMCRVLDVTPNHLWGYSDENLVLDIFEELLSLAHWWYESFDDCSGPGLNSNMDTDEEDKQYCYNDDGSIINCETCEQNITHYYFTNGKVYYELTEDEFALIRSCIKPYFDMRLNELFSLKKALNKSEFESEVYGYPLKIIERAEKEGKDPDDIINSDNIRKNNSKKNSNK